MNRINQHQIQRSGFPEYQETTVPLWDTVTFVVSKAFGFLGYFFSNSEKRKPPEAKGHAILGSLPEFAEMEWDTLNFIAAYHQKYGMVEGISKLKIFNKVLYVISDPKKAKQILRNPTAFVRGQSLKVWEKFSEGGLSEGEATQRYRGQAVKAIGSPQIRNYFNGIVNVSKQWVQRLAKKERIDIMQEMERATLAAMAESLFKMDPSDPSEQSPFSLNEEKDAVSCQFLHAYHTVFEMMMRRLTSGVASLPWIGNTLYSYWNPEDDQAITDSKETLKEILTPIFNHLLENPEKISPDSHLLTLFHHFDIDPNNVDIEDLIEKCLGFLQAAFETASKCLGWTLYSLAKNENLQEKLREVLVDRFHQHPPKSLEELLEVPLLSQVMEESLRMFPPFPFLVRDIVDPEKFEEYEVEKGGAFVISPLLIQRSPENWDNPLEFQPERFSKEMLTDHWQVRNPKYMTFLGGPHRCPGRFFGKQEILIFLSQFLQNFKISLNSGEEAKLRANITLHPSAPLKARIESLK